ncbi:DCL family protein [Ruficoccus amylovorans]|uniref:DCL family protein n=1 Tax=Ruficoccus amylovorans TaxID=1804625 RepID=A0A842HB05_9BACT|nr:DCL family protein [Ruficoccus amylovorans]MBC2592764.1 DCL family protein [Ruficoccus amylovorans]
MAKPVTMGDLHFSSGTKAKAFLRGIRDQNKVGERISPEHELHLRAMVAIHPEAEEKTGVGIDYFTVELDKKFRKTRHFMIHRIDGSTDDVSFHAAIDGANPRRDRMTALRVAINSQVITFKNQQFDESGTHVCPIRGVPITPDSYHVDHAPPCTFIQLVQEWLDGENIQLHQVEITEPRSNQCVAEMANDEQRSSWTTYHRQYAKLRLLSPEANTSSPKA